MYWGLDCQFNKLNNCLEVVTRYQGLQEVPVPGASELARHQHGTRFHHRQVRRN